MTHFGTIKVETIDILSNITPKHQHKLLHNAIYDLSVLNGFCINPRLLMHFAGDDRRCDIGQN